MSEETNVAEKVEEKDVKTNTVVLNESTEDKAVSTEKKSPTREELKTQGWSAKELDAAEKRGMISKKEEKKSEEKKPEVVDPKNLDKPVKTEDEKPIEEKKPFGTMPEFTMTKEQEEAFLKAFPAGTPQNGTYLRMKSERRARQMAEQERDRVSLEKKLLEDRIVQLEKGKPEVEVDENGNEIDPEDKPLTARMLREMKEREEKERQQKDAQLNEHANRVASAMKEQEDYAKEVFPDFDDTVTLAKEVMQNIDSIPEKWKRDKAVNLIKELQIAAAYADKKGLEDYNAPMIAYEIGQMHPNFGKKGNGIKTETDDGNSKPEKANGSLTPEQMKRIEKNTQRGASSASIPGGGGRRVVSIDDITVKDVLKMSTEERMTFKKKHPEKMAELLRG